MHSLGFCLIWDGSFGFLACNIYNSHSVLRICSAQGHVLREGGQLQPPGGCEGRLQGTSLRFCASWEFALRTASLHLCLHSPGALGPELCLAPGVEEGEDMPWASVPKEVPGWICTELEALQSRLPSECWLFL